MDLFNFRWINKSGEYGSGGITYAVIIKKLTGEYSALYLSNEGDSYKELTLINKKSLPKIKKEIEKFVSDNLVDDYKSKIGEVKRIKTISREEAKKYINLLDKQYHVEAQTISLLEKSRYYKTETIDKIIRIEEELKKEKTGTTLELIFNELKDYYLIEKPTGWYLVYQDLKRLAKKKL